LRNLRNLRDSQDRSPQLIFTFLLFSELRVAQGLLFLQCRDAGGTKDVLKHYGKEVGGRNVDAMLCRM
jgi:hypothetical protein